MLPNTATRLAETSLALYAQEGDFATAIEDDEGMEAVAKAFGRLGCTVSANPCGFASR